LKLKTIFEDEWVIVPWSVTIPVFCSGRQHNEVEKKENLTFQLGEKKETEKQHAKTLRDTIQKQAQVR
jgi:hypothetical protein